jgi:uncharacterized protein YndB with AHSA1/START domain
MNPTSTDRIEKSIVLRAPRSRVWKALTEPDQFGAWFGVKLAGRFNPGAHISGQVTQVGYEHIPFQFTVEQVEPEHLFSWRWHVLVDPDSALVTQPTTLVVFTLEDAPDGTLLTVTESGFDSIPPEQRDAPYRGNEDGWTQQMDNIERYLSAA